MDNVTSSYTAVAGVIDQSGVAANTTWNYIDSVNPAAKSAMSLNLLTNNGTTTAGYATTGVTTLNIKATDQSAAATNSGFDVAGMVGLTKVVVNDSTVVGTTAATADRLTVSSLASGATLGIKNNGQYQNITANYVAAATQGSSDTVNLEVTGRSGAVTIGTGFETAAITTSATTGVSNRIGGLTTSTATSVTVAGTGLRIDNALDATVTSFNAASSTGAVDVYITPGTKLTAVGGTGTGDVLATSALNTNTTVSGFEKVVAMATGTYDLSKVSDATTLGVATGSGNVAFTNAAATQNTISLSGANQQDRTATVDGTTSRGTSGTLSYALKTSTGVADALTVNVDNGGTASTGTYTVGATTANGIESITLNTSDWKAVTFGGITDAVTTKGNLAFSAVGSANLTLGTLAVTGATTGTNTYNFSKNTGTVSVTLNDISTLTYTGSDNVDTVTQAATDDSYTATYNLGAGNDAFTMTQTTGSGTTAALIATSVINGEAGDDTFTYAATTGDANNSFAINGGDGTDTLYQGVGVGGTTLTATIASVEKITLANTAGNSNVDLTVASGYADTVLITDVSSGTQLLTVASTGNVDLTNWTQLGMTAGTDTVTVTGSGTIKGMGAYGTIINGSAAVDNITGGTANDTINGKLSADILTGGTGTNTFVFAAGDTGTPTATNYDTITDFRTGTTNRVEYASVSLGTQVGTAGAGVATVGAGAVLSFNAADTTFAQHLTAAEAALHTGAGSPTAGAAVVWQEGSDTYMFVSDNVAGVGANDVLIKLTGTTVGALTDGGNYVTMA